MCVFDNMCRFSARAFSAVLCFLQGLSPLCLWLCINLSICNFLYRVVVNIFPLFSLFSPNLTVQSSVSPTSEFAHIPSFLQRYSHHQIWNSILAPLLFIIFSSRLCLALPLTFSKDYFSKIFFDYLQIFIVSLHNQIQSLDFYIITFMNKYIAGYQHFFIVKANWLLVGPLC